MWWALSNVCESHNAVFDMLSIVVQVMSGSEFGRQLYKLMEMGELVPTVSTTSPYICTMAIFYIAMEIMAFINNGQNIWDGGAGPAGRGHDHRYWRAQGWLPPWRLPSQPRPGRSLRSLHRTTIKSHLSVIGPGMCLIVMLSRIKA